MLVFVVGGWYFFHKNLNLNLKNVGSKSLNCQKILERIPDFKKRQNPSGQEDPLICYFEYAKDKIETIDDVNIVGNGGIPISVALDLDEQGSFIGKYNNNTFKGQKYDDIFTNLNFISSSKELPKPQGRELDVKDTGQINLMNGKGAFYEYGFNVNSKIPRSQFTINTVGRNGECVLTLDLAAFTDETLIGKYHPRNGRDYSNTHPDFDHGKKRIKDLAMEYLHKLDVAVSDFCGQTGQLVQSPLSNPQGKQDDKQTVDDILSKIRNYKVNNALDGYDSETAAKIADEITKATFKSSAFSDAPDALSVKESLADLLKRKDPNYKDFDKAWLDETEQRANSGELKLFTLMSYGGGISVRYPDGEWHDLKIHEELPLGSTIMTSLGSDMTIVTGPLILDIGPLSEISLTKETLAKFHLPNGKIEFKTREVDAKVEKNSWLSSPKIDSPNATASPTGTRFFFWYNKDLHLSIIGVYQGSVDIQSSGSGEKQTVAGSDKSKPNIMAITDKGIIKL